MILDAGAVSGGRNIPGVFEQGRGDFDELKNVARQG